LDADFSAMRKREKKVRDYVSFPRGTDALHHLAIYEITDAYEILLKTLIDLFDNTREPAPEIFDPG
jgi:hypothetical protein